ncbi:MAG: 2-oxoglutarate oxidoreductase [Nitrospirae bacterium]|nr:2-oxoglutarate oxidoreductase [Nitrospirota bacterium]
MNIIFDRPESLKKTNFRYCPGCGHSIIHRIIAETIDKLGIREQTIGIAPVGCAVFAYDYFNIDMIEVPHGRPPAAATGMKRVLPDKIIFSYQGDGDLAAIGTAEIIHAANRGENLSMFFVNNTTYGMTGGQMAPTTLAGQRTSTTPKGRSTESAGHPIRVAELLSNLDGVKFSARAAVDSFKNIAATKKLVEKVFLNQINGKGFSFLEILSPCPTDWGMTPEKSIAWLRENMIPFYQLGIIKDLTDQEKK